MLVGFIDDDATAEASHLNRARDWIISRQRCWGTPIPIVHCTRCGIVPVPRHQLPVHLPDAIDWSLGGYPLSSCESFVNTPCPKCDTLARRETDTLDCFFDDMWCYLQAPVTTRPKPGFTAENLGEWLPVDRAQSGLDTAISFHTYRFLVIILHVHGLLSDPEPIRSFIGNEMVLSGDRKMSKHLGNAVSPEGLVNHTKGSPAPGQHVCPFRILWTADPRKAKPGIAWGCVALCIVARVGHV